MTNPFVSYFLATALLVYSGISLSFSCRRSVMMESSSLMQQQQLDLSNDHLPTYSKLTQLILNKYDLSVGENSTNSHEKLYNAILGMELAEHDGKPVPIHGHPYLFVGSAGPTFDRETLKRYGITHIIGLSKAMRPRFPNDFVYMSIEDLEDNAFNNISRYFGPTSKFIETAKAQNGKVLVHCWQGQSRSVSIIVAHLIKADRLRYQEAIQLVRKTRKQADPIHHFVQELKQYEKVLLGDRI